MSSTAQRGHPIFDLPIELFVEIISHVPTSSYLDVVQTCQLFRRLLRDNAATICNRKICRCWPAEIAATMAVNQNGWLLPTHPYLYVCQENAQEIAREDPGKNVAAGQNMLMTTEPGPLFMKLLKTGDICLLPNDCPVDPLTGRRGFRITSPYIWIEEGRLGGVGVPMTRDKELIWYHGSPGPGVSVLRSEGGWWYVESGYDVVSDEEEVDEAGSDHMADEYEDRSYEIDEDDEPEEGSGWENGADGTQPDD